MNAIEIHPMRSNREQRIFLQFPWRIYRGDPLWVPPLIPERRKVINPQQGAFFKRGEAEFFIAWRDGKPVGTICCAEDHVTNQQRGTSDCMIGFFECVNDEAVARAMFQYAINWAKHRQLKALFGPFNLDYEDSYGVLIEGYDQPPALLCGHNPPYYRSFFENFGFSPARGKNLAYAVKLIDTPALQRLSRLANWVRRNRNIQVRGSDLQHWDDEIDKVHTLLNRALRHLPDFIPWQREALLASLEPFKDIADPELVLFAEVEGQAVGWFAGIPNLNEAFIHANGLRYPWNYVSLLWYMRRQPQCLAVKSVLVLPEYWERGVSILLFDELAKRAMAKGYRWADLSLTSDDNPYTPALAEKMGAEIYKRYQVYRYWI
ncbi:MAG: GNAT family N-acetyltransferase [Anaerolineales bacterium]|nr:GNAT family N-acetyltransferase [Anaerolineales bacterium]